jgi:hypothetical protein
MPRNTTVKTVETVQATVIPDVQSLRIAELENQVRTLTAKLESVHIKKFSNFVNDFNSASSPLLVKCGLKGKHGITPFGYQSKLELVTEKVIREAGLLTMNEKKTLSFLSKAGSAFITLCDSFDKWTEMTSTKKA